MNKTEFTKVLDDFEITHYEHTKDYVKFRFNNVTFWVMNFDDSRLCISNDNNWNAFDIVNNHLDLAEHILEYAFN